jgi:hypothetical protein
VPFAALFLAACDKAPAGTGQTHRVFVSFTLNNSERDASGSNRQRVGDLVAGTQMVGTWAAGRRWWRRGRRLGLSTWTIDATV